jgi:endonuclease III
MPAADRTREVDRRLETRFPGTAATLCALHHANAFELLVATVLSAQCTDARVNLVTPALFAAYPTPWALAGAPRDAVEEAIRTAGFFHAKAAHLQGLAASLVDRFDSTVPEDLDALCTLPGVGRKTANVVRSVAFGVPGLPVDTHVTRLSHRLDLTRGKDPVAIERSLCRSLAPERWGAFSSRLILHGRQTCTARRPRCETCVLADLCPRRGVRP